MPVALCFGHFFIWSICCRPVIRESILLYFFIRNLLKKLKKNLDLDHTLKIKLQK